MSGPLPIVAQCLGGLPHGFFGREGGVSTGTVASLNVGLGAGDDPAAVAENRARVTAAVLPGAALVTPYQVHSPDVSVVTAPWPSGERPRADAVVTDRPGLLLGIVTADCTPVLLADQRAGVVGAVHAGWRGAHCGVAEAAVAAMVGLGADPARIAAAIGPTIRQPSYEVDDAFRDALIADRPDAADLFVPAAREGHRLFDLPGYVARRLGNAGVATIEDCGLDTYSAAARFFSYRRATHLAEPSYGRQIAVIGLGNA